MSKETDDLQDLLTRATDLTATFSSVSSNMRTVDAGSYAGPAAALGASLYKDLAAMASLVQDTLEFQKGQIQKNDGVRRYVDGEKAAFRHDGRW